MFRTSFNENMARSSIVFVMRTSLTWSKWGGLSNSEDSRRTSINLFVCACMFIPRRKQHGQRQTPLAASANIYLSIGLDVNDVMSLLVLALAAIGI